MSSIGTEEAFNNWNIYVKVLFLKPLVKCITKTIHFHDKCTCTEGYNVDLGLYEKIWQLEAAAGFYIRRMWRYYSSLCRVLFLLSASFWRYSSSTRKNGGLVTTRYPWLFAQPPCRISFRSRSMFVKLIIAEFVVNGRPFPWICLQTGNL